MNKTSRPWNKTNEEVAMMLIVRMGRSGGPEKNPVAAKVLARVEAAIEASKAR
jgi:hypothetical protein